MLGIRQTWPYRPCIVSDDFNHGIGHRGVWSSASPKEEGTLADGARTRVLTGNRILDGLSRREYARIAAHLSRVTLKFGLVLGEPGAVMHSAYFLETAVVSAFSLAQDGTSLEVSVVGNEGMVGVPIVLGSYGFPYRTAVQRSGTAWRMKADVLRREFYLCGPFHRSLLRYVHTLIVVLSQSSSCNRFHSVQQRLSTPIRNYGDVFTRPLSRVGDGAWPAEP